MDDKYYQTINLKKWRYSEIEEADKDGNDYYDMDRIFEIYYYINEELRSFDIHRRDITTFLGETVL